MAFVKLTSGEGFEAKPGESLLAAANRSGIQLNYSCKTGRCSSCKCKLISGETGLIQAETGLSSEDESDGWILGCVRHAVSDIVIDVENFGNKRLPEIKTLPCRISQMDFLAPDVLRVFLRFSPNAVFDFLPGQYVDVIGAGGVRRSYSLANTDFDRKTLELHIRKFDNGVMSRYWFKEAKLNDLLRIYGPLGTFFLRDIKDVDLIFLSTGTGIAPVKSIVESIKNIESKFLPKSIHIFWGGRFTQDLYFDVLGLDAKLKYIPVLSRAGAEWSGAKGYVQDVLLSNDFDLENSVVYACGSSEMIQDAKKKLTRAGLSPRNFYSDAFVPSNEIT